MKKIILSIVLLILFSACYNDKSMYVEYTYDNNNRIKSIQCSEPKCNIDINSDISTNINGKTSRIKYTSRPSNYNARKNKKKK